ncbi:kinase-like domain-containing protein [Biscogniauxia marginata]|nr:kinase-like domain-containing protein [Biscogniauxia marginata]
MAIPYELDDIVLDADHSTFDRPRLFSSSAIGTEGDEARCSFITFLTTVQKLQIPFVPATWRSREALVGEGGTSIINQALMIKNASLVFKRVAEEDRHNQPVEVVYRRLVNEIMMLYHPAIQEHPNILGPRGICWDVFPSNSQDVSLPLSEYSDGYKIWPVLAFEKSKYGDLYHFSSLSSTREFDIIDRLKICLDIGAALGHMQLNHIIHGDIKPQNILLVQDYSGFFSAQVADFGFATSYAKDSLSRVVLVGTALWSAPEVLDYPDFTPAQAMCTDVFSFGMVCLWFMFEKYLSGVLPLPPSVQFSMRTPQDYGDKHQSLQFLRDLKVQGYLTQFANSLIDLEPDLSVTSKQALQKFFTGCLEYDPQLREADVSCVLRHLDLHLPQQVAVPPLDAMAPPGDDEFDLYHSLHKYYGTDYRVRSTILHNLEEIVANCPTSPLSKQLELCYELGFGHPSNYIPTRPWAYDERETRLRLRQAVNKGPENSESTNKTESSLIERLSLPLILDIYIEDNVLATAESVARNELDRAMHVFGAEEAIVVVIKEILASIVYRRGQLEEAETLGKEIMEANAKALGQEHPRTLTNMGDLASTYAARGRFEEAERLELEMLELRKNMLGEDDTETLEGMTNLAVTLTDQGRFVEAEKLLTGVVHTQRGIFGPGHPRTVYSMGHLASALLSQGRTEEAKRWASEAVTISETMQGREHHETLGAMSVMMQVRVAERRVPEAEQLQAEILESVKRVLGPEHPETLTNMYNLALLRNSLGRHADARGLMGSCADLRAQVLGQEHPDTKTTLAQLEAWRLSSSNT